MDEHLMDKVTAKAKASPYTPLQSEDILET